MEKLFALMEIRTTAVIAIIVCLLIGIAGGYGVGYTIYQPQIKTYEAQVSALTAEVSTLNRRVLDLTAEISKLSQTVGSQEAEISALTSLKPKSPSDLKEGGMRNYAGQVVSSSGTGMWAGSIGDPIMRGLANSDANWQGQGSYALGKPDGLPCVIQSRQSSQLTVSFGGVIKAKELKVYLVSLYSYSTAALFSVDVSENGATWQEVSSPISVPSGNSTLRIPLSGNVGFARVVQLQDGIHIAVDAFELN